MEGIEIEKDGETFVVRMSPTAFAAFAFWLLSQNQAKPSEENGEAKRKRIGRPPKDAQSPFTEVSA